MSVFADDERISEYTIRKTGSRTDWNRIPELSAGHVLWTEDYGIRATGQICYDDENLYVHLSAAEQEIRAENTEPASPVYEDSCLEFFFMLPDTGIYFNFEVNPNGCLNIQAGPQRNDRFYLIREDAADYFDIRAGLTADGWDVFYRIPLSFIRLFYPDYRFQNRIYANVYKCGDKTAHEHYLAWNRVCSETPDFHRPEDFGVMYFA